MCKDLRAFACVCVAWVLLLPLFPSQSLEKRCDGLRESRTAIATTLIAVVQGVLDGCGVDLRTCGDLQSVRVLCVPRPAQAHICCSCHHFVVVGTIVVGYKPHIHE